MKTYWDHEEQERASLTDSDVQLLLDVELMKEGVKKPIAPKLTEVPKSPLGARQRLFGIEGKSKYGSDESLGICFATPEAAQAFIDLCPLKSDYDYEIGSEFRYCIPLKDAKIVSEELYGLDQINEFRSTLKQRKALSEENQRQQSEFTSASQKAEKVTENVWKDWYRCKAKRDSLASVISTYGEYLKLTSGDGSLALTFLEKIHNGGEIQQAREWFPNSLPEKYSTVSEPTPAL